MEQKKILAVMGSPGSGKTLTSIKIATTLAKQKKNVILLSLDCSCPVIPYILPSTAQHDVSVGELMTKMEITQADILAANVPVLNNDYLSVLSYKLGESAAIYPKLVADKVTSFLIMLNHLADYVIVDCSTDIFADTATIVALQMADVTLKLSTSNLKGISYFYTADKLLADRKFNNREHLMAIGNLRVGQEWEKVSQQFGNVKYVIPYCEELEQQGDELRLFEPLIADESSLYNAEIKKMTSAIFGIKELEETPKKEKIKKERKPFKNPFAKNKGEF